MNSGRFCARCGAAAGSEPASTQTVAMPDVSPLASAGESPLSSRRSSSSGLRAENRFVPGAVLAGRYRIIALLGCGGMGEVYRADDLSLGQQVALKFLPPSLAANPGAVERFRNEVRIARQISHPNVCRVYDIGEADGRLFLSMEYVDGEDLGSLLRRIGRLPSDKALEIARGLCAGLAAAHEKGVLHRDLKPANIMLDGRGHVLLMDFGLAAISEEIAPGDARSGTPAYMAPEQLTGEQVTVRSDIYSLGLVLYELFTGRQPFEAANLAELVRMRASTPLTSPSTFVRDLDPAVERVIARCLESNPRSRPASALAVAAALPGGDPLAAALAAGETPSPEMVAAAGEGAGLAARVAAAVLLAVAAGLAGVFALGLRMSALERIRPELTPDVLVQKARDDIRQLGYTEHPADQASAFMWNGRLIDWLASTVKPAPQWDVLLRQHPSPLSLWYRRSQAPMTASEFHTDLLTPGMVDRGDPAPIQSGMIAVELDHEGRLTRFEAIPPERLAPPETQRAPAAKTAAPFTPELRSLSARPAQDWSRLFTMAGLDLTQFHETEPLWTSLAAADTRTAWTGKWPGSGYDLRVEAAALRGKPVSFRLIGPWAKPQRMPDESGGGERAAMIILGMLGIGTCAGSAYLARRHLRQGRGDPRGALRLSAWIWAVLMALWVCQNHFTASIGTFGMFAIALATATFYGVFVWTLYIALEPFVRRQWPQTLISWTAALSGRLRDPVVGRDVLFGVVLGVVAALCLRMVAVWSPPAVATPDSGALEILNGARGTLGFLLTRVPYAVRNALFYLFLLLLLRVLLRCQWLAAAALSLVFAGLNALGGAAHPAISAMVSFVYFALIAIAFLRWGLLSVATGVFVSDLILNIAPTLDSSAWFFGAMVFLFAIPLALAGWAAYVAAGLAVPRLAAVARLRASSTATR